MGWLVGNSGVSLWPESGAQSTGSTAPTHTPTPVPKFLSTPHRYQPPKAHFLDTAVALSNQDEAAEPNWPTGRFPQTCSAPALRPHGHTLAASGSCKPGCQPLECVLCSQVSAWLASGKAVPWPCQAGPAGELLLDPFTDEPSPLHEGFACTKSMQDVH